jgi:hypothetical protein
MTSRLLTYAESTKNMTQTYLEPTHLSANDANYNINPLDIWKLQSMQVFMIATKDELATEISTILQHASCQCSPI